ncbi:MAG: DUF4296 domain-containing protein [Bacteroidales bacterium]|nr:DUF4296 domain-containing protein [Bacteroidales bacterium]
MKRRFVILMLLAAMVLVPSCRRNGPRVIPRGKLAKIYAEMFVTDQWIQNTPKLRSIADTSLVYEPILEKYGYSSEDYQHSVQHYMDDPERFSRILRTTGEILDDQIKDLKRKQKELQELEARKLAESKRKYPEYELWYTELPPRNERNYSDTISVGWDTASLMFKFRYMPRTDTIYEGVRMIIPADTLTVADSLAVTDSLAAVDSVAGTEPVTIPDNVKAKPLKGASDLKPTLELDQMDTLAKKPVTRRSPVFSRIKKNTKDEH